MACSAFARSSAEADAGLETVSCDGRDEGKVSRAEAARSSAGFIKLARPSKWERAHLDEFRSPGGGRSGSASSGKETLALIEEPIERGATDAELTRGAQLVPVVEVEDVENVLVHDVVEIEEFRSVDGIAG